MAFAETRIRSLETARECVRLGARQRTIAWVTGLPTSFIFHNVFDARHRAPRGRPPYSEDFIFRSSLRVQAEASAFASKYRLLTTEGVVHSRALITAFKHYREVLFFNRVCVSRNIEVVNFFTFATKLRHRT